MMLAYYIMRGLKLMVELPTKLYNDNQGAVQLANNWLVGGRTRHISTKTNYLSSLKEKGFLIVLCKKGTELIPDIGTKNVTKKEYIHQTNKFVHPKMLGEGKGIHFIETE